MSCANPLLPELFIKLMDANSFFWDRYRGRFEEYVHDFFLEEYFDDDRNVIDVPQVYWWDKSLSADQYVAAATQFLDLSEKLIAARAQRIIKALQMSGSNMVEYQHESI